MPRLPDAPKADIGRAMSGNAIDALARLAASVSEREHR